MESIEIVRTNIEGLSSLSIKSAKGIEQALLTKYEHVRITTVDNIADLESLVLRSPSLVFLGMKYVHIGSVGKIWMAEYLAARGIATTGSDSLAHQLELDKSKAKARVIANGLVTSPYLVVKNGMTSNSSMLMSFPMFVKPNNRGGGLGIDSKSVVHSTEQLYAKAASIHLDHKSDSLVEKYLSGREFSVAILISDNGTYDAMPIELVAPLNKEGDRLLSGDVKKADAEAVSVITDKILEASISTLALAVFEALGARDYGRIDIRLDEFGIPHFLEANLIPSLMNNFGSFPKACKLHKNLSHTQIVLRIVELSLARSSETILTA